MPGGARTLYWFRKAIRLHDNPSLAKAVQGASHLHPVFCLDHSSMTGGATEGCKPSGNRMRFLLESLSDLDESLRALGSGLQVVTGEPEGELKRLCEELKVERIAWERETEPTGLARDSRVEAMARAAGIEVVTEVGHTLVDTRLLLAEAAGKPSITYSTFQQHFSHVVHRNPISITPTPTSLPPTIASISAGVPTMSDVGYQDADATTPLRGGEKLALERMNRYLARQEWICKFEKPSTSPCETDMNERSTTVLSPYLAVGSLSCRVFYEGLKKVYKAGGTHSQPPVSLEGQMLWREFYYVCSAYTPNYDKMQGNPICRQIPWGETSHHDNMLEAWQEARTGYPWIDACMTQLKQEGHIHHLARHAVACFLTRGDLWVSWEKGALWFESQLLDADWALNSGNWMWLSCSCFFYQYFRCYSPVAFAKKWDPEGNYIRKYVPALRNLPAKYIYEPWKAPIATQRQAGVELGKTYPKRIVVHETISKENMGKMNDAYSAHKRKQEEAASDAKGKKEGPVKKAARTSKAKASVTEESN
eukprot:CAMPEP_0173453714 /NCGR_PEP_ID=MMETSP1357-20121228/51137_1 /TAXON_ID=77926 /ORGANISM="Hemiselmis rufescens, Strain PCC563" /LENGTH=534 /DNA_ID=CAMNT_0014420687 /DNA_START=123 /DNA_END=1727 /DNA_ORIENTATION=+